MTKSFKNHGNFLHEMIDLFERSYNKETLIFEIPKQLKEIQKKAAGAEMITKNNIQPLKLIYAYNIVQKSIAYIFINTKMNGLIYKDAQKKGLQAAKIFNDVLEFTEVSTFTDLKRKKIIKKLENLKERSKKFTEK